ncbi:hypothetical protein JB92DRAFT_2850853 [Gautieria morchelliformis]|nr:hypothetical protein JB92DRAFT_2850853 [Gautieria morchelliformis]
MSGPSSSTQSFVSYLTLHILHHAASTNYRCNTRNPLRPRTRLRVQALSCLHHHWHCDQEEEYEQNRRQCKELIRHRLLPPSSQNDQRGIREREEASEADKKKALGLHNKARALKPDLNGSTSSI